MSTSGDVQYIGGKNKLTTEFNDCFGIEIIVSFALIVAIGYPQMLHRMATRICDVKCTANKLPKRTRVNAILTLV